MLCAVLSFVSSSPAALSLCESPWTWKTLLWRDVSLEKQRRLTCVTRTKPVCCCGLYAELHLLRWITTSQTTESDSGHILGTCFAIRWSGTALYELKRVIRHSAAFSVSHHFSVWRSRPPPDKCSMSAWNEGFDSWGRTEAEVIWLRQIWTPLMEADCWCLRWCWWNVLAPSLASSTVWCVQADVFPHTHTHTRRYTKDTSCLTQSELYYITYICFMFV